MATATGTINQTKVGNVEYANSVSYNIGILRICGGTVYSGDGDASIYYDGFAYIPVVTVAGTPGNIYKNASIRIYNITKTGCKIGGYYVDQTTFEGRYYWIAIGKAS